MVLLEMAGIPQQQAPHAGAESAERLDSFASAAGLMQLSSAAMAADAAPAGNSNNNSNSISAFSSSPADASLPPGWQRIVHGSGLPCYVHNGLGVVCWTRPYPLDVGGDALSLPELHRLVKQHVPPLSIFAAGSDVSARRRKEGLGVADAEAAATAPPSLLTSQEPSSVQMKKRKLDAVIKEQKGDGKQQAMTLEEFKTLSIGDPRVLQACMELSIKTPAQVLQEYQNRNRGVSINYNTVPVEGDGVKLFKTIVTAGCTVAEGVASTKKIAKQLGAQQLLAKLHERTARKYHEVAEMYNSSLKGQPVIAEATTYGPATPLRNDARGGRGGNVDPRVQRSGSSAPNRMRRARRSPPHPEYEVGAGYREYEVDRRINAPSHWSGYNQQLMQQHVPQQAGSWTGGGQQGEIGTNTVGPERVVVYSQTPVENAGNYGGGQYYNNANVGGNAWGGYPNVNHPPPQPNLPGGYPQQQYNGVYGESQQPPGNRPYGDYHSRSSDRPNTSTPIERVTMEGFLLVFAKEHSAQVQYCVLEHGMLRCFDQPGGELRESVGLTRHRIRVQPLFSDNAGTCPNRFAVHALEVRRNDHAGAFVSAGTREKTYCFAAANSKTMIKWANAVHNWRRHAFDDPTSSALSVHDAITDKAMKNPDVKRRAALLENQRLNLVSLANRFDVKLVTVNSNTDKKPRGLFRSPSFRVSATHKDPVELKTSRPNFAVISWLPGRISALRPSLPGR
ncbi:hypothetical protein PHYPSEUDO_011010 [Phytophthora pseudosyringae]|uniref:WW domain-containing protein n=1 Tax=Phytophthora pseudosyringae TaxID=221518 RepID=A0A8T1VC36_9STRA|nr:hypothetical protein PHYPSEUDO_011010 [Phytophthora pseudosyringae]